jgi:transposase
MHVEPIMAIKELQSLNCDRIEDCFSKPTSLAGAYVPELNPIERIWRHLRGHHLSNRAYTDRDHLEHAAHDACSNPNASDRSPVRHGSNAVIK